MATAGTSRLDEVHPAVRERNQRVVGADRDARPLRTVHAHIQRGKAGDDPDPQPALLQNDGVVGEESDDAGSGLHACNLAGAAGDASTWVEERVQRCGHVDKVLSC